MSSAVQRTLAWILIVIAALGIILIGVSLLAQLTDRAPLHVDERIADTHVEIDADRTNVPLWTSCMRISWRISGIKSVFLNGEGRPGIDSKRVCASDAEFTLTLMNDSTTTYVVQRNVALGQPSAILIPLIFAAALLWQGLFWLGRAQTSPRVQALVWLDALFSPLGSGVASRRFSVVVLAALFVLGAAHWVSFFDMGHVELTRQDWALERHYWEVMAQAVQTQQIPFFIQGGTRNTDNFLGNPETTLSPLLLFMPPLSPGQMALGTTLGVYVLGFWGVLLIRRRYRLSLFTFAILFLLLNFNGFITAHLGVGHVMYLATLLLPFFMLYLLEMADGGGMRAGLKIGVVFLGIELLGGYNFLVWCGELLVLFALVNPGQWRGVLFAAVSGIGLTAVRVLPAALTFAGQPHDFLAGFPTPGILVDSLTTLQSTGFLSNMSGGLGRVVFHGVTWWEFDMYIGLVGFAFVLICGIVLRVVRDGRLDRVRYAAFDIPLLVLTLFSMGDFYKYISTLPIPLANVDRNSSRIFIMPLTLLIVLACLRFEVLLPRLIAGWKPKLVLLSGLWLLTANLELHSQLWSLTEIERRRGDLYVPLPPDVIVDLSQKTLDLRDKLYVLSLPVDLALTLIAAVVCVWYYRRLDDRRPLLSDNDGIA